MFIHCTDVVTLVSPGSCDQCKFSRLLMWSENTEMSGSFKINSGACVHILRVPVSCLVGLDWCVSA